MLEVRIALPRRGQSLPWWHPNHNGQGRPSRVLHQRGEEEEEEERGNEGTRGETIEELLDVDALFGTLGGIFSKEQRS